MHWSEQLLLFSLLMPTTLLSAPAPPASDQIEGEWRPAVGIEAFSSSRYKVFAPGGAIDLGLYRRGPLEWRSSWAYQLSDESQAISRRESRWTIAATYGFPNSFYVLGGLALRFENYEDRAFFELIRVADDLYEGTSAPYTWTESTLGVETGFGNKWSFRDLYVGIEWLNVYLAGIKLRTTYTKSPQSVSNGEPTAYSLRFAVLQIGMRR